MTSGEDKKPDEREPEEPPRNEDLASDRESTPKYAPAAPLAERLERERRRAVRAEGRLAEIELRLRREIDRSNGGGVSVQALQTLLDGVQRRVASLEDEVRASERELMDLVAAQRKSLGAMAADNEDLAFGLEESRRELRDEAQADRTGLPELTRRRVEFEVELDRLQSLLNYRDSVCDGLAEELEQGTRVTAEVTARLADLSRGRVAPARRLATQDARVTTLRRNLESEQVQLRQSRRALEAARAELKVAQRGVADVEERTAGQLGSLRRQVKELSNEREALGEKLQSESASSKQGRSRLEHDLERERASRVQANEAVRALEKRLGDLDGQLEISGGEREDQMRQLLSQRETELEQTESERIRLAERVSLLQAALSSKDTELRRLRGDPSERRPKGKVVSLVRDRLAEGGESKADVADKQRETADLIRQRESDLDQLSERWRELQDAYREAVTEFDDVRAKRDRLLRKLGPGKDADPTPTPAEPPSRPGPPDAVSTPDQPTGDGGDDTWVVQESAPRRTMLVQIDDDDGRKELLQSAASEHGIQYAGRSDVEVPHGCELLLAVNLLSETVDLPAALSELSRDARVLRTVLYAAAERRGRVFGAVDIFPAPFDPKICAPHLLASYRRLRRVMTVGDSLDMMSQLRELLGQSRCSTAVAFDPRQAFDLIPLVRPEYVLIDMTLPSGGGVELLSELSKQSDPPVKLGLTWSRPLEAERLRVDVAERCGSGVFDPVELANSFSALVEAEPAS